MGIMKLKTCRILKSLLRKIINVVIGLTNAAHISVSHSMKNLSLLIHYADYTPNEDLMEEICIYLNGIFRELFKKSRQTKTTAHIKVQKFQAADKLHFFLSME